MTPNYLMLFMAVFFIVAYLLIIAIIFSDFNEWCIKKTENENTNDETQNENEI